MLVLARQIGQKIMVGESLVIKVHDIEPRTVWVELIAGHPLLCRRLEALRIKGTLRIMEGIDLALIWIRDCKDVALGINAPRHVQVHRDDAVCMVAAEARR